jgi:hypothetical protein
MYVAERVFTPTFNAIVGVLVTVTASEKLTVTRIESPTMYVLSVPANDEIASEDTVAALVSYEMVVIELSVLFFPAVSVNLSAATDTEPVPLCVFAVGVNVAVYEVPEPANVDNVPPLTVMSASIKLVDASDNVNVSVDVSPNFNVVELAEIDTVGAVVSTVTVSPVDVDVTVELERYVVDSAVTTLSPAVNTSVSHDHSPVVAFAVHVLPEATALSDAASRSRTYNCTVEPTGAEPVKVSVVADVMLSVDELPKSSVA